MRVGVLLVVVGVVGACGEPDYGPVCSRWIGSNWLPEGVPCPSEGELRENCPKYCNDPSGTDCQCMSPDASMTSIAVVACVTTHCYP